MKPNIDLKLRVVKVISDCITQSMSENYIIQTNEVKLIKHCKKSKFMMFCLMINIINYQ